MAWFSQLFTRASDAPTHPTQALTLHNTLGNKDEVFVQPEGKTVRMYNCGPTVYGPAHIGNLRSYIFADVLRRTLEYNGHAVKQVINITDVGHLASDGDVSGDKMTKGLLREGLEVSLENMKVLGEKYTKDFIDNLQKVGITTDTITFPRASAYIDTQIAIIKTLEEKGYTYLTNDGVYFDTARFPAYGELGNIDLEGQMEGARVETNPEKHTAADFNLWKKDEKLGWDSPWGKGFPGWHIECSAMIRSILGEQIDIHTGGVDLIATHHNNEIAQSEAASGKKPFSRIWMHNAFLNIEGDKISKSLGNTITLDELPQHGIHPLALRYFYLGARYSTPLNFSWEALKAAQQALLRLHFIYDQLDEGEGEISVTYQIRFHERINDDLDTPGALAVIWDMLKDKSVSPASLRATLKNFDFVLGLAPGSADESFRSYIRGEFGEVIPNEQLPDDVRILLSTREEARTREDWANADELRAAIQKKGYAIEDTPAGARLLKK